MVISYQIIKEEKILLQRLEGEWSNHDFEKSLQVITQDSEWQFIKKGLTDLRGVKLQSIVGKIDQVITVKRKYIKDNLLNVLIVDTPLETAMIDLYITQNKGTFDYKYCSSFHHAIKLLDLDLSSHELDAILQNLRHKVLV